MVDVFSVVQDCVRAGALLATADGDQISVKGNKRAPALATLRSLVVQDRAGVLAAIAAVQKEHPVPAEPELSMLSKVDVGEKTLEANLPQRVLPGLPKTLTFEVMPWCILNGPADCTENEYRAWLWERMNEDAEVLADIYTLCDLYRSGVHEVVIEHTHAAVLERAARHVMRAQLDGEWLCSEVKE